MKRTAAITLAIVCASACPTWAAEDGGTQSVFALGAGNRALGMGGAFVASSADASAMFWNPAGLGRAERSEFQFAQSGDLAFGATESYAGLVIPNWKWGALGITMRHFGVGGVEARDDRNVATGETFNDSEVEMAVGYGRQLGPWWAVGGAAKVQRQSIGGFSGSAVGLDLGLSTRPLAALGLRSTWAEDWTWALAVRNVIEPSIHLALESVPDPTAVRTGLAWHRSFRAADRIIAEVDIEKSRDAGARVRAGIEYGYRGAASVRAGFSGGQMAAGTSLHWRDLSLDYAYQDGALETTHRVGLSVPFGATVRQAEAQSVRAQDEALERRLAEAFQKQQEARIASLIGEARAHLEAERFDDALLAAAMLRTLVPGRPEILSIELAAHMARAIDLEQQKEFAAAALGYDRVLALSPEHSDAGAGAARCRAESDRVASRTESLRRAFAAGMDALSREDYVAAHTQFQTVLLADPADEDARKMLKLADTSLQRQALLHVDEADRQLQGGQIEAATQSLRRAMSIAVDRTEIDRLSKAIERARQVRPAPAITPKPAGPVMEEREADDLYRRGLTAVRASRSAEAVRYWELVWASRPGYRQVADLLKREYLTLGLESFAAGHLEAAIGYWNRVLEVDPRDDRARGYLDRARQQANRSQEILDNSK